MSMFTQAFNTIRSTVSNPKFYTSARAGMGRAVASAQAYAPKVSAYAGRAGAVARGAWNTPLGRIGMISAGSAVAGAAIDKGHRGRGAAMGGAFGILGVGAAGIDRYRNSR